MRKILIYIFAVLLFFGCSAKISKYKNVSVSLQQKIDTKQKLLAKRFAEYWHYRLQRDFNKTFLYELPYQQYVTDPSWYKENMIYSYGKGKIVLEKIEPIDENETMITKIYLNPKGERFRDTERWFYVLDNWYHKFYQHIMPPE